MRGPEPLASMPAGGPPDVDALAFDVDDTVTGAAGRLRSESLAAMERLATAGWRLVAVTGRPLGWAEALAVQWPVDLVVAENGAGWRWRPMPGRGMRAADFLEGEAGRVAQDALKACAERIGEELRLADAEDQPGRRWDRAFALPEGPGARRRFEALAAEYGLRAFFSSVHAHLSAGWDKAEGLRRGVASRFGSFEPSRWLFVGDGLNDAPLFATLPYTVGVANVAEALGRLPAPPRWITPSPRAAGFVELAERLLAGPGPACG